MLRGRQPDMAAGSPGPQGPPLDRGPAVQGERGSPGQRGLPGPKEQPGSGGNSKGLQEVDRTRTIFPETWLWTDAQSGYSCTLQSAQYSCTQ